MATGGTVDSALFLALVDIARSGRAPRRMAAEGEQGGFVTLAAALQPGAGGSRVFLSQGSGAGRFPWARVRWPTARGGRREAGKPWTLTHSPP